MSVAVIVAVAVNSNGRREVLGMTVGASEAETFWAAFLRTLARRRDGRCEAPRSFASVAAILEKPRGRASREREVVFAVKMSG